MLRADSQQAPLLPPADKIEKEFVGGDIGKHRGEEMMPDFIKGKKGTANRLPNRLRELRRQDGARIECWEPCHTGAVSGSWQPFWNRSIGVRARIESGEPCHAGAVSGSWQPFWNRSNRLRELRRVKMAPDFILIDFRMEIRF
ncbi:MAG: hypothetical protein GY846_17235 [Deltaproteobacteria bacterium]|nr:hypothetical protein [Deltaproteobacteria bacterium]